MSHTRYLKRMLLYLEVPIFIFMSIPVSFSQDKIYWTDHDLSLSHGKIGIEGMNLDGSDREVMVIGSKAPRRIAIDEVGERIFWLDDWNPRMMSSNLDGSDPRFVLGRFEMMETVPAAIGQPDIDIDQIRGKIYWTRAQSTAEPSGKIRRSNLDGTVVEDVLVNLIEASSISIDSAGGKMYWVEGPPGLGTQTVTLRRADLNGTSVEDLLVFNASQTQIADLDVDSDRGKIYWLGGAIAGQGRQLHRTDLDGSNDEVVYSVGAAMHMTRLSVDEAEPAVYVIVRGPRTYDASVIRIRPDARIDRASVIFDNPAECDTSGPFDIAMDNTGRMVFFSETDMVRFPGSSLANWLKRLLRMRPDGSGLTVLKTGGRHVDSFLDLAVDSQSAELIWVHSQSGTELQRLDSATQNVDVVGPPGFLSQAAGFAADTVRAHLYRAERTSAGSSGIHNAGRVWGTDLDGRNATMILNDICELWGIDVDSAGGKLYWMDGADAPHGPGALNRLRRSNLDGSGIETLHVQTLISRPLPPVSLRVDPAQEKLYLPLRHGIERFNFDGSQHESLLPFSANIEGFEVNLSESKIYWVARSATTVSMSASLDGSNPVVLGELQEFAGRSSYFFDMSTRKIYWSVASAGIHRSNFDGSIIEQVTGSEAGFIEADFDPVTHQIYLSLGTGLGRIDFDGTNFTTLAYLNLGGMSGLALNPAGGHVYVTRGYVNFGNPPGAVQRLNVSTGEITDIVTGLKDPKRIQLDIGRGKVYWSSEGLVQRANFDGSGVEELAGSRSSFPSHMILNRADGKIYWIGRTPELPSFGVYRAQPFGIDLERVITMIHDPSGVRGLAVDEIEGKAYWTESTRDFEGRILRADFLGGAPEVLVGEFNSPGIQRPADILIDPAARKMYWVEWSASRVRRANLDGTVIEDILIYPQDEFGSLPRPKALTLDFSTAKMYIALDKGFIHRANFDGSQLEEIVLVGPGRFNLALDMAVDEIGNSVFLLMNGVSLYRFDKGGANLTLLLTQPVFNPAHGIFFDSAAGKIYWSKNFGISLGALGGAGATIQRSDSDGSNVEDVLFTNGLGIEGLALDLNNDKIYWTNTTSERVHRANLDGSIIETLVAPAISMGLTRPQGIALDVDRGKMYWADSVQAKIFRANMDGTVIEEFVSDGLVMPMDVELDLASTRPPPAVGAITSSSGSHFYVEGESLTLFAPPTSVSIPMYVWKRDGVVFVAENRATLDLFNLTVFDAGNYVVDYDTETGRVPSEPFPLIPEGTIAAPPLPASGAAALLFTVAALLGLGAMSLRRNRF